MAACGPAQDASTEAAVAGEPAEEPPMGASANDADKPGSVTESTHAAANMSGMNMGDDDEDTSAFTDSIDYIEEALGTCSWDITTNSAQAQKYFNQVQIHERTARPNSGSLCPP